MAYKVKSFDRFARKNKIPDGDLATAADEVLQGNFDADLGGGVYKQRVARKGGGKSGGFRTLITHKTSDHFFSSTVSIKAIETILMTKN